MTKQQKTIVDKLTQPHLTYGQGVTDCWIYLYCHRGMRDLADEMLEFVADKRGGKEDD